LILFFRWQLIAATGCLGVDHRRTPVANIAAPVLFNAGQASGKEQKREHE